MILSFHPCHVADRNILCAGREPDEDDLAAIRRADAVILPQGCRESLYRMARRHCRHVFPNYDVRFDYPGKLGQIHLFRKAEAPHPATEVYESAADFYRRCGGAALSPPYDFPFVFKFDWGGEGEGVHKVDDAAALEKRLKKAEACESTGQTGFLLQEFIRGRPRTLRVVVIGQTMISYWRVQKYPGRFHANLRKNAVLDAATSPDLQAAGKGAVRSLCGKTGINLAGFDLMFSEDGRPNTPLLLEINYYFGRRGLGGSERFYRLLIEEIEGWLEGIGVDR